MTPASLRRLQERLDRVVPPEGDYITAIERVEAVTGELWIRHEFAVPIPRRSAPDIPPPYKWERRDIG